MGIVATGFKLNRRHFIEEILNVDFQGDEKRCAIAMGVDPSYFHQMLYIPTKNGGNKLLGGIFMYCEETRKDAKRYLFDSE